MASHCCYSVLILSTLWIVALGITADTSASNDECKQEIVETMPEGITDLPTPAGTRVVPTHEALIDMVNSAKKTIRIAGDYLELTPDNSLLRHPITRPGQTLLYAIVQAALRGVDTEIVLDRSNLHPPSNGDDVEAIEQAGGRVKYFEPKKLLGTGRMHSKFMIVDSETFYVGSANFDWGSYTQVKEIGLVFKNCPRLAKDLDKIYRTYTLVIEQETVPPRLSRDFKALTNLVNPVVLEDSKVSLSASPPAFNGPSNKIERTQDIDGLVSILDTARHTIDISVRTYRPMSADSIFHPKVYWPVIEHALRRATTERGVRVRLLFSKWYKSDPSYLAWYKSLDALNSLESSSIKGSIHVKLFEVPSFEINHDILPFARNKHDTYTVTDNALYVGTSYLEPYYYLNSCGVGVLIRSQDEKESSDGPPQIVQTMQALFERDFNSRYAHDLEEYDEDW